MRKSRIFIIFILNILLIGNPTSILPSNLLDFYNHDIRISQGQEDSWATVVHEHRIFGTELRTVNNDSIYFVGNLQSDVTYITSYNRSGKKLWEFTWRREENTMPHDFTIDSENFLYVAGAISNFSTYGGDIFLLKINSSGQLIWARIFKPYTRCTSISITLDIDKSLYISGVDYYYDNGYIRNVFLIKLNDSGDVIWDRVINMGETWPENIEMHVDSENNVIHYIGTSLSSQYLIKYDTSGSTIWYKEWGEEDGLGISKVILNDGILITGITNYQNNDTFDAWIMKINSSGDTISTKRIGNYGDNTWYWWDSIWHYDYFNNIYFLIYSYLDGMFLFKFNSNLSNAWNYSLYNFLHNGYYSIQLRCDSHQNINLIYGTDIFTANSEIFLLKLNSSGNVINDFSWGGPNRDDIDLVYIDSQDNLYFTCGSEYIDRWNVAKYYTILVKNPKANGNPPEIDLGIDQRDMVIFSALFFTSLISFGITLTIVLPYLIKNIRKKK
ncbi:MAG: hypothetical protein ACW986_02785 [Promethearchaeota archaeon]